ncbi:hypothetical protein PVAND_001357 [Polypedilum vanderplanki]|uniref:ABC transporter domain-containing protein n=1 Tax=Polypedilum vanderplanki TaxID=319348 RepID=A0A9J6BN51_POLVA|nr:hypothetical protein PVAND_001357 [Polypedilum vanderplanki]
MFNNCIKIQNVFKSYQQKLNKKENVLNGISLNVERGQIYALAGSSGCGKTTLLNCLMGMYEIDSGEIEIFNQQIEFKQISKLSNIIGFMPQQTSLVDNLTIMETLQYFANLQLMDQKNFIERFKIISDLLELPAKNSFIKKLSGGEQRRVSLAVTIIHNPQLLILDEPTVGLDFKLRNKIWNYFEKQTTENKLTILVTTHCMNEVKKSHRCGFMRDGILIEDDKPLKIMEKYETQSFDEAFYQMCLNENENREIKKLENCDKVKNYKIKESSTRKVRKQIIKALLVKEFHRFKRAYTEIYMVFIYSIFSILIYNSTFGKIPKDLKLGIVNYEIENYNCDTLPQNNSNQCENKMFLCGFFNHTEDFKAIFYKSYEDANQDLHDFKIINSITITSGVSILAILQSRMDGVWNRSLLNGVSITEILIANFIQYTFYSLIISIELILLLIYIVKVEIVGRIWLAFLLIFGYSIDGFLFGLNCSIIFKDFISGHYSNIAVISHITLLSGIIWPTEGFSKWLKPLEYILPLAFPLNAQHGVTLKGYGITHPKVASGFAVIIFHMIFLSILLYFNLKRKLFY